MTPKILFSGMTNWYLNHTARESHHFGCLSGYWMGSKRPDGVPKEKYKRVWPYYVAQKPFYHFAPSDMEERMRWVNLPFYHAWVRRQKLPSDTNVVQGPMGSCESLFGLADASGRRVLKVFDAPNSHPTSHFGYWQRECDLYFPGYEVPGMRTARPRINREIEMADLILCPSEFVRDSMVANGIPADKCFISHFGVNTEIFKKRKTLPEVPKFVYVGSLTLRKGQQYLLRAFEKVRAFDPRAELICVGSMRKDFKKEMERWQGKFTWIPGMPHAELANLLTNSTAFVMPSLEEGFARVLSEAMAAGIPILASYESGATTVIRNGVEGYVLQPRNIDSIAEAMIDMIKNREKNMQMGEASYIAGAASNTWRDYTKRLLTEYEKRLSHL
jgi:glycosyltransferase involved in cell wall biosynthesis